MRISRKRRPLETAVSSRPETVVRSFNRCPPEVACSPGKRASAMTISGLVRRHLVCPLTAAVAAGDGSGGTHPAGDHSPAQS